MRSWIRKTLVLGGVALATMNASAQQPVAPAPAMPPVIQSAPIVSQPFDPVVPGVEPVVEGDAEPAGDLIQHLFPQDGRNRFRGWLDGGYIYNSVNPNSRFNGPYNSVDRNQEPMFNQAYLIAERVLPTDGSLGIGGRFDALYGEDFFVAQSTGLEANGNGTLRWNGQYYGLALPQIYGEAGNNVASVKLGHFYTVVGYESVQTPLNYFYSRAYSYQFAGPFTHWGALGILNPNENIQLQGGIVNGWNNLSGVNNAVNFLGSAKYTAGSKKWWSSFAIITGPQQDNPGGQPTVVNAVANRTRYSLLFDATPTDRLEYVFHHWLGLQNQGRPFGGTALWYGIDQYMYYRLSSCWRLGGRFEWFRDEDGTRVGLNRPANPNKVPLPGSYYSLSAGPNWSPVPNFVVRPEIRWDFYNGPARPFADGTRDYQLMLGCDAILHF